MCTCIIYVNYYTCISLYRAFWCSHGSRLQTCLHPDSSFHGYSARPHRYNDFHYFLTPPTTLIFHSHLTSVTYSQISDTRLYRWASVIASSGAITDSLIKHWLKPFAPPLLCNESCLKVKMKNYSGLCCLKQLFMWKNVCFPISSVSFSLCSSLVKCWINTFLKWV